MLIRKTQQPSDYPENQIHDAYSTSATDTYSCNYINNNFQNSYDLITDGEPVKTGRKIDGKDEYIKRYHFTGINSVNNFTKSLGFTLANVTITKIEGVAYSNVNNCFPITIGDFNNGTTYSINAWVRNTDNTVVLTTVNGNFKEAYINIKYINIK